MSSKQLIDSYAHIKKTSSMFENNEDGSTSQSMSQNRYVNSFPHRVASQTNVLDSKGI